MQKLKQLVLKRVKTKEGNIYFVDVIKINDSTGMGGFHSYSDINTLALNEYRDLLNLNIQMMEKIDAMKFILTVDEDVEL